MTIPTPGMRRALRQARLYGWLIERDGQLYHPGGSHPVCTKSLAARMVKSGWLVVKGERYEPTTEALRMIGTTPRAGLQPPK